jgi:hypothetical protein
VFIEHCYIHNFGKAGVYCAATTTPSGTIYHATVRNCVIANIGLLYETGKYGWGNGVAMANGGMRTTGSYGRGKMLVENCIIHRCSMHTVDFEPGQNSIIRNNYLATPARQYYDAGGAKDPWNVGLQQYPYGGVVSSGTAVASTGNTITNNLVETGMGWGIVLADATTTGNSVTNNINDDVKSGCITYSRSAPTGQDSGNSCSTFSSYSLNGDGFSP